MDSESYLLKIIRSGSKGTADSLYLQTTIGKDIRWPIVLLISTVITVLAVVLCMVWRQVRRPVGTSGSQETRFRQNSNNRVSESSSSSPETRQTKRFSRDHMLTCSVVLENSPNTQRFCPRLSKSDQDLASWVQSDSLFTKRKVSWAPSHSAKHFLGVPKIRRHSEITPSLSPINLPDTHCSFSGSSLSTIIDPCSPNIPVESDAAIIKVNKPSQLHLQISKTIAVLDDLNKSLQENHSSSDSPPPLTEAVISTPVVSPNEIAKRRKGHKHKFFKPLVKNTELLNSFARSPSSQDAKTFDELEPLLDEPL